MRCGLVGVEWGLRLRDEARVGVVGVVAAVGGDGGSAKADESESEEAGERRGAASAVRDVGAFADRHFAGEQVGEVGGALGGVGGEQAVALCAKDGVDRAGGVEAVVVVEDEGAVLRDVDVQVFPDALQLDVCRGLLGVGVGEVVVYLVLGGDAQGLSVADAVARADVAVVALQGDLGCHESVLAFMVFVGRQCTAFFKHAVC